jgi:predicted sugar kinase
MSGTTEAGFVPSHFVKWQKRYGEAWRKFIDTKLRPALFRNDLFAFLRHGWELNSMSNMKVLEGIFRTDVMREFDETMQREGAIYAGMSSAGPGFYAFTDSEEMGKRIARIMRERFGMYMSEPTTARAGQKLSIEVAV